MSAVRILVPVSGGKDSQAALELACRNFPANEIRGLFCDTKWEHPLTYAHVDWMQKHYGVVFDTACGGSVLEKSIKYGRWPGGGARHCTDELKIRLTREYCKWLALLQGCGFEVWYGMRSAESDERAKRYAGKVCDEVYLPHEVMPSKYPQYLGKLGVKFRLPVLHWSDQDVQDFVGAQNLNPLYEAGFPRVGCFPCLASGDRFKEKAFAHDDFGRDQLQRVIPIAASIGKSIWTSKGGKARNEGMAPCAVCAI